MAGKQKAPAAFIAAGIVALRRVNARRHLMPKCRAMSKTTGNQCQQFPMENGLCYYHGGRTPKGKEWHKPQWPKKTAPDAERKMVARLRDLERAEKKRQKRLAQMTPEKRAAFDKWHRDRPRGTPAQRAAKKLARKQNEEARARFAQVHEPKPLSAEAAAIQARIEELEAQRVALTARASERPPGAADDNLNPDDWSIFG